jgi:hypothetical protein
VEAVCKPGCGQSLRNFLSAQELRETERCKHAASRAMGLLVSVTVVRSHGLGGKLSFGAAPLVAGVVLSADFGDPTTTRLPLESL